jgi:hypothetical protein
MRKFDEERAWREQEPVFISEIGVEKALDTLVLWFIIDLP